MFGQENIGGMAMMACPMGKLAKLPNLIQRNLVSNHQNYKLPILTPGIPGKKVVSLKRFVNVSEKAVQVEETPQQTESEKILYKCRKLSVGRQFDGQQGGRYPISKKMAVGFSDIAGMYKKSALHCHSVLVVGIPSPPVQC